MGGRHDSDRAKVHNDIKRVESKKMRYIVVYSTRDVAKGKKIMENNFVQMCISIDGKKWRWDNKAGTKRTSLTRVRSVCQWKPDMRENEIDPRRWMYVLYHARLAWNRHTPQKRVSGETNKSSVKFWRLVSSRMHFPLNGQTKIVFQRNTRVY